MNLKKIRNQNNISQEQLAEISGLNVRTIQRIEKGRCPSLETLKCLAAALNVEMSELTQKPESISLLMSFRSVNLCFLLLSIAAICVLIGAKAEITNASVGAFFYISAAICFTVTSVLMLKNRLGGSFGNRT